MSYDKNNIFAKIIRGDLPAQKIYEDDNVLAFNDISRASPVHVLVVPKGEYIDYNDFVNKASAEIVVDFFKKISQIAKELNIVNDGFRLITNNGSNAHQTVKHFHVHLLAGKKLGPLISSDNLNR
ncbi:MAG: HIT domain-containing protein [Rickettsiales bacterium]